MSRLFRLTLVGVFFLPAAALRAGDREAALAIIDQAIRAHGGESALSKAQTFTRNATGVMSVFGKELPFKDEMIAELPGRFRSSLELGEGDQKLRLLVVVNRTVGWQASGGGVMDIGKERLGELLEEAYVLWLTTLTPLKKDNSFDLAPLPETRINGQPTIGVKVGHKAHTEAKLYFDRRTNLLVKIERRAKEAGLTVEKEYLYSDHKDYDGVKLAGRQIELLNDKKFSEVTSFSYKFMSRAEESAFAKP